MIHNLVLDLDNTLIYCPTDPTRIPRPLFHLKHHHVFLDNELYVIFERPYLETFLRKLKGKNLAIWTAASHDYAQFIVHHILQPYLSPGQKFAFVWDRRHCDASMQKYNVLKHLSLASKIFKPSETLILDDNSDLLEQPHPVRVVRPFYGDLDDTELLHILADI